MSDKDVFRIALPGFDVHRGKIEQMVMDNRYPSPKIDTQAVPPHAGLIFLDWRDTSVVNYDVVKTIYSFPHRMGKIPIVVASYKFDNGTVVLKGTLPFQLGSFGMIVLDADEKNVNLKYYSFDFLGNNMPQFTMQIRFYVMAELGYE